MPWNVVRQGRRPGGPLVLGVVIVASSLAGVGVAEAGLPRLKTEVAFPNLKFNRPVVLADPGDGSNLLFVVEQPGIIASFPNQKDTSDRVNFLEIRPKVNSQGNEEGLLGLAFHPKYKDNGKFFVYYSWKRGSDRYSVVSQFNVSKANPRKADPASEKRIWVSAKDPFENHNGGCILFGPDGYLYISLGDSGAADDPLTTGQNPKDWFGSILRIDVDHPEGDKAYGIPSDNPARRDTTRFKDWAPEVYCIGLRNVWKFSFDREKGTLWAGDVGQNLWEMVHVIENGGNYGWNIKEAFHDFRPRGKVDKASPISPPIVEYPHNTNLDPKRKDVGLSITGGYVYRGKALPDLVGAYVYGDYDSGRIWGVRLGADGKAAENAELIDMTKSRKLNIASFGEDAQGELYILAFDGKIHRLAPR
jgi:glucose/arabinose dehydrogenase